MLYFPDVDVLDVHFGARGAVDETLDVGERYQEGSSEHVYRHRPVQAHFRMESGAEVPMLAGLTIEEASRRAPVAWAIGDVRRFAAVFAESLGMAVTAVRLDHSARVVEVEFDPDAPLVPDYDDEAVAEYRRQVAEVGKGKNLYRKSVRKLLREKSIRIVTKSLEGSQES